jgi:LL-diaminopimelate aminotransferase
MAPEVVRRRMVDEIGKLRTGYADNGIPEFKEAAARFMQRFSACRRSGHRGEPRIGSLPALAMIPAGSSTRAT